ncbi:MAG: glycoside hydrolase family 15 protein [Verrucomicrobiaceae bacterium]|nr:glycoside hydrolase family 15 protein [Verrucomicrobiaceae bacterium]
MSDPTLAQTTPKLDHGVIGNGRVLALISPTSAIEWLCMPRFDSPSVFARILDRESGGTFIIEHASGEVRGQSEYLTNTNVLRTVFEMDDAAWEVLDFAPRLLDGMEVRAPFELARLVRPLRGHPRLRVRFDPRPDYGRAVVQIMPAGDCLLITGGEEPLRLFTDVPMPYVTGGREFALDKPMFFSLVCGGTRQRTTLWNVLEQFERTVETWRRWAMTCALPTFAADAVLRSALVLKLHQYHDTGAIIAATTTSIPEAIGTQRTWDYRYCWLRDAAFVVEALRRISHLREGEEFLRYLRDVAEAGPLQPLYGIGGERDLREETLDHLAGFANTKPVRVGNQAAEQRQNDLMGEVILCLETLLTDPRLAHLRGGDYFPLVQRLVEEAIVAAPTLDTGIWEFRQMPRAYTFSRAMCWVAIERGAKLADHLGECEHAARWRKIADEERELVLARGYNAKLGFFTQALDGEYPDASLLLLPTLGIISATDARFISTVEAYERLLAPDGFMKRYINPDDFGDTSSAFTICSFWWCEALALMGRLDDAVALFQRLMRCANPLGLFSEDIEPADGTMLGNFPQAYTHVGLIHAAMTISELLEARDGKVRAWT